MNSQLSDSSRKNMTRMWLFFEVSNKNLGGMSLKISYLHILSFLISLWLLLMGIWWLFCSMLPSIISCLPSHKTMYNRAMQLWDEPISYDSKSSLSLLSCIFRYCIAVIKIDKNWYHLSSWLIFERLFINGWERYPSLKSWFSQFYRFPFQKD